ncbi:hypothetical protein ACP70R_000472 [Stipagrostis hirtigluma subsp. patula]
MIVIKLKSYNLPYASCFLDYHYYRTVCLDNDICLPLLFVHRRNNSTSSSVNCSFSGFPFVSVSPSYHLCQPDQFPCFRCQHFKVAIWLWTLHLERSSTMVENFPASKVNDVELQESDDQKVKDFMVDSVSNDDAALVSRSSGFRMRIESIFGNLLSVRGWNLQFIHCLKVPAAHHKQSELLILNTLQLLKKSIKIRNSGNSELDSTSSVSGLYDDILEFLDDPDFEDCEGDEMVPDEHEFVPDFLDELCDHFKQSLDVSDMNFDPQFDI